MQIGAPPSRLRVIARIGPVAEVVRTPGRGAGLTQRCRGLVIGVLTGVGGRADLEPLADRVIESIEQLRIA